MNIFKRIIGKSLLPTIAAVFISISFTACCCNDNNDNNDNNDDYHGEGDKGENTSIIGTWKMMGGVEYPAKATFQANGEYEWEWGGTGLKDNGTYTMTDSLITMTIKERWQNDTKIEIDPQNFPTRVCYLYMLQKSYLVWNFGGDYYYGAGQNDISDYTVPTKVAFMLNSKYNKPDIQVEDGLLDGEWIAKDEEENIIGRIIIDKNIYTAYKLKYLHVNFSALPEYLDVKCSQKYVGTFKFEKGYFIVDIDSIMSSYKRIDSPYEQYWVTHNDEYDYSNINPLTLEADRWLNTEYDISPEENMIYSNGKNLFIQNKYDEKPFIYRKQ